MDTSKLISGCELHLNEGKQTDMHPDLKGPIVINGKSYEVALWTRTTQDGSRIYHSATIRQPFQKGSSAPPPAALLKNIKLYEFRKRRPEDPDYQSPSAVQIFGDDVWLALWVKVKGPSDLEDLSFSFQILKSPYTAVISEQAAETLASIRARLVERDRELEEERDLEKGRGKSPATVGADEVDNIPF